jgi:hypothetical protein
MRVVTSRPEVLVLLIDRIAAAYVHERTTHPKLQKMYATQLRVSEAGSSKDRQVPQIIGIPKLLPDDN